VTQTGRPADDAAAQRARADRLAAENAALRARLDEAEQERRGRDRHVELLRRRLAEAVRDIGDARERTAEQAHRAEQAEWRAETMRRRRWWRLGEALTAVRRRPLAAASYRRVAGALRGRALPPAPPAAPKRTRRPEIRVADTEPLDAPAAAIPDGPVNRPGVTAAVVASPAVALALRYEWRQLDGFRPGTGDWRDVFAAERPDLLLVESAATGPPAEEMAAWCREHRVPTVYWDTGDGPPDRAALFDHVFAVDRATAARHPNGARLLPFAAQPRLHNPVRVPGQGRYPLLYEGDYDEDDEPLLAPAPRLGAHFRGNGFPHKYRQRIVEPLPYEKSLTARKHYQVLLAADGRQPYEAAAAGIPVVLRREAPGFGPAVADADEGRTVLRALLAAPELRDRQAHLALREVLAAHTYRHRVGALLEAVGLRDPAPLVPPPVSLVLSTNRPGRIDHAIAQAARQTWRPLQLVIVLHGLDEEPAAVEKRAREAGLDDVAVLAADRSLPLGACLNLGLDAAGGAYIGKIDDDELYGPHYVADLVAAFSYADAGVVGKLAHYAYLESAGATVLRWPDREHRHVDHLRGGALLAEADLLRTYRFADLPRGEDTDLFRRLRGDGVRLYAADRYSFVTIRHADPARHTWRPDDRRLLANGRVAFYGFAEEHVLF
jgi:hypothetical protein